MSRSIAVLLVGVACCVAGGTLGQPVHAAKTAGKVRNGVYTAPSGRFTVPVPKGLGMRVNDHFNAKQSTGAVSFSDDFGNLDGILYTEVPSEHRRDFEDSGRLGERLSTFLEQVALPLWFLPASKNAALLHQEVATADSSSFIGIVSIPGGSPLMDLVTKKRLDSVRAARVFYRDGWIYVLITETGGGVHAIGEKKPLDIDAMVSRGGESLAKFMETIRFSAVAEK